MNVEARLAGSWNWPERYSLMTGGRWTIQETKSGESISGCQNALDLSGVLWCSRVQYERPEAIPLINHGCPCALVDGGGKPGAVGKPARRYSSPVMNSASSVDRRLLVKQLPFCVEVYRARPQKQDGLSVWKAGARSRQRDAMRPPS